MCWLSCFRLTNDDGQDLQRYIARQEGLKSWLTRRPLCVGESRGSTTGLGAYFTRQPPAATRFLLPSLIHHNALQHHLSWLKLPLQLHVTDVLLCLLTRLAIRVSLRSCCWMCRVIDLIEILDQPNEPEKPTRKRKKDAEKENLGPRTDEVCPLQPKIYQTFCPLYPRRHRSHSVVMSTDLNLVSGCSLEQ